ncbi:PAS domain S-box protein [Synechocystis salina]|uniref:PAS domain S-box protein n=1 Tax=Synechocystis salina LEGE 00031 TaxID=1828736 RepID=A0ABR9VT83_9SYNC|nr:PAS domain S-box protein [Synechocystis salina]MBE9241084.1 PAS domain S-box protein [Synechocystis salina LEGE 00041]MBE9254564.1 PAS domain S-box protein [Synechocystis salina LEGE 00031]
MADDSPDVGSLMAELQTLRAELAALKSQQVLKTFFHPNQPTMAVNDDGRSDPDQSLAAILQESEEQFLSLVDNAPVLICIAGLDKGCLYFNQSWLDFTGRTLQQEQGNGWTEGIHPEDFDHCLQTYVKAFDARQPYTMEYRLRNRQGEYHWLLENGVPRFAPDGKFLGYMGYCIDINDRQEARRVLEASEEKYRTLVESLNTIVGRWSPAGTITFANQYAQDFFGFSAEEMVGKSVFETIVPLVSSSGRDLEAYIADIIQNPEKYQSTENENIKKNGDRAWIAWTNKPIFDKEGNLIEFVTSGIDITDRKLAEDQLRQRETELIETQKLAKLGRWKFDLRSGKINWSEEIFQMFGRDPQQGAPSYQELEQLIHPDDRQRYGEIVEYVLQTGQTQESAYRFCRTDGSQGWIWAKTEALFNLTGEVIGLQGVAMDITKQKEAEIALQNSESRFRKVFESDIVGIMFASLSGEVAEANNCLLNMLGYSRKELEAGLIRWDALTPAEHRAKDMEAVENLQKYGLTKPWEKEYYHKDGHTVPVLVGAAPFEGNTDLTICVVVDIKQQKQALRQRERVEAELEKLNVELEQRVMERTQALAKSEEKLYQVNEQLQERLEELKRRNQEMELLSTLNEYLQSCVVVEDACASVAALAKPLFPDVAGAIFIFDSTANYFELAKTWGAFPCSQPVFNSVDCWALRRGQVHWVGQDQHDLFCNHLDDQYSTQESLCIPLVAQGETLGLLNLCSQRAGTINLEQQQLAKTIAEQVSLAIANIKLRERLENQSIRDPLTGLFNRRYLEQFFLQEIGRARRYNYSIGVIMGDIDHFKQFNDQLGHDAGDHVLKVIGRILQSNIRGSDIACRYGGEEMTIVLPQTSMEDTLVKAESLRQAIATMAVDYKGRQLGTLTVSLGVACYPDHGQTMANIIQAADRALYQAKDAGRNRVIMAD